METLQDIRQKNLETPDSISDDGEHSSGAFDAALDSFLDVASHADSWNVEQLLKRSAYETTEIVVRAPGERKAAGPPARAIRKRIDGTPNAGAAYEALWRAQQRGVRIEGTPQIYECVRTGKTLHVLMEYIKGPSLEEYVASAGPGVDALRKVALSLCRTVHDLHTRLEAPLIHRDLKPSNIIMSERGPVVIDYGISRVWHQDAESDTSCFATRCYAPPEQFGFGQTDERSDVYALGKIFYFCLTGEHPPNVCTAKACKEAGIDEGFAAVIAKTCSFNPTDRYASARALARAAEQCVERLDSPDGKLSYERVSSFKYEKPRKSRFPYGLTRLRGLHDHFAKFLESKLSTYLGKLWNVIVLFAAGFLLSACAYLVACPNERDAVLPVWFRFLEYIVMLGGIIVMLMLLLLDRRRISVRFPLLVRRNILLEAGMVFIASFFLIIFVSLCGSLAGLH